MLRRRIEARRFSAKIFIVTDLWVAQPEIYQPQSVALIII